MVHSVYVDSSCQQYADEKMLKRAPAEVCDSSFLFQLFSATVAFFLKETRI